MDVVKETTNKLRGRMSIETQLGQGTRIAMEFPLTLAVLPVLYLRVRKDIYALPISAIDSLTDIEERSRALALRARQLSRQMARRQCRWWIWERSCRIGLCAWAQRASRAF